MAQGHGEKSEASIKNKETIWTFCSWRKADVCDTAVMVAVQKSWTFKVDCIIIPKPLTPSGQEY